MDPKALILLVLSAFAAIILAIGAGMGQDYRSKESINSTAEASMNRSSTAEGANIYSSTSEAPITSTFASENANPYIEINTECIKFFTEYDQKNCSYKYNEADCYSIQLPEDKKLTDVDRDEINGIRQAYPDVHEFFPFLKTRRIDAQFINRLLNESGWYPRDRSEYFTPLKHALDIINELDRGFGTLLCKDALELEPEFLVNKLEALIYRRGEFAQVLTERIEDLSWNKIDQACKDKLINLIIQIGDSLDIFLKGCWEDYVLQSSNNSHSFIRDICSTGKRLGSHFRETFSNNTSTQSYVRPKRDLSEKKPRNNAKISEAGEQVPMKKQDDLAKTNETPKQFTHVGKSHRRKPGNGYLLRSRKRLTIKNTNKIPF